MNGVLKYITKNPQETKRLIGIDYKKNQLIVLPNGAEIVDVTVGQPGTSSDINLLRARQSEFDANQRFKGDKGYIGEMQIETPHKKPKQQELTGEQKEENKQLSVKRITVDI